MALPTPKIATGARAVLKINNKPIAYATNVGYRIGIPHSTVYTLGRYSAARLEPVGYDVTCNCGVLRFTEAPGKGNAADSAQENIQPSVNNIINSESITIQVLDRKTEQTILYIANARMVDRGGSVDARGVLSENWSFIGIIAQNSDSGDQAESSAPGTIEPNNKSAE